MRLLADKAVELEVVPGISHESVRQVLKKNEIKPWEHEMWVIRPEQNAEFMRQMEAVLDVYKRPYDPGNLKRPGLKNRPLQKRTY